MKTLNTISLLAALAATAFAGTLYPAGVNAAQEKARLRFGAVAGNDCAIEWNGANLTIPQHTDKIADHAARIADLELVQMLMQANQSTFQAQLDAAITKLDALHTFVHHTSDGLARAHSTISAVANQQPALGSK